MDGSRRNPILNYLRRTLGASESAGVSDTELLRRFVNDRDEAAFELLLWRHAAMVLHVCRQILRDEGAAEDAFQATFLVLARKASSISRRESPGGWLHRVASRIALKARAAGRAKATADVDLDQVEAPPAPDDPDRRELRRVICEEVNRLPAKYRAPIIACYFESRTHEEAAHQLGWPRGTVAGRLSRAREMLRRRLLRRGVALAGAALVGAMSVPSSPAALNGLVEATIRTMKLFAANGAVSPRIAALAEGVLRAMFWTRMKIGMAILLIAGLSGAGATLLSTTTSKAEPPSESAQRGGETQSAAVDEAAGASTQKADDAAKMTQNMALSRRNLKELAIAMHNYADTYGRMPAPAIYSKDGKALLSWRVALLPYLDQNNLYRQFHLDESWDSPHNRKVLETFVPKVYAPPGKPATPPLRTYYQVFVSAGGGPGGGAGMSGAPGGGPPTSAAGAPGGAGAGSLGGSGSAAAGNGYSSPANSAAFVKGRRVPFPAHFSDGTSNTILIVEAGNAVPWTKPEDLHYAADEPLPELGGLFPDVFHAAFADGTVHTLTKKYDEATLRGAITAGSGEVIDLAKVEIPRPVKAPTPGEAQRQIGRDDERLQRLRRINEDMLQATRRRDEQWNRLLDEKQKILETMLEDIKRSRNPEDRRPPKPIEKKQPTYK